MKIVVAMAMNSGLAKENTSSQNEMQIIVAHVIPQNGIEK